MKSHPSPDFAPIGREWKGPVHKTTMKKSTAWPEIHLDRSTQAPTLRQQIEMQLASAIRSGELPYDCRLPSSRLMATLLNVSRGTVVDAYETLLTTGVLVATPGSGIHVAHASPSVPNFSNLKRTAVAAHYPTRVCHFDDWDGTALYLNLIR
jgi:DNA-binding transcriptional regulator YhcF (GntR family)